MIKYVILFLLSFALYLVFVGSVSPYNVVTGLGVSIVTSALTSRYLVSDERKLLDVARLAYLIKYVAVFAECEVKSHLQVIKAIITGDVTPGIVKVPYDLESSYSISLTACSITNTPGTVVVDLDVRKRVYYVHWLNVRTFVRSEMRELISRPFEELAKKIFD